MISKISTEILEVAIKEFQDRVDKFESCRELYIIYKAELERRNDENTKANLP